MVRLEICRVSHWQCHHVLVSFADFEDLQIALNPDSDIVFVCLFPLLYLGTEVLKNLLIHDLLILEDVANLSFYNH